MEEYSSSQNCADKILSTRRRSLAVSLLHCNEVGFNKTNISNPLLDITNWFNKLFPLF